MEKKPQRYLYLLRAERAPHFKVGTAKDITARVRSLREGVSLEQSYYVTCDGTPAHRIERLVHVLFANHCVNKEQVNGNTQWFHLDCLEDFKSFFENNRTRLHCSPLKPWPKPVPNAASRPHEPRIRGKPSLAIDFSKPGWALHLLWRRRNPLTLDQFREMEEAIGRENREAEAQIAVAVNHIRFLIHEHGCRGRAFLMTPDFLSNTVEEREFLVFRHSSAEFVHQYLSARQQDFFVHAYSRLSGDLSWCNLSQTWSSIYFPENHLQLLHWHRPVQKHLTAFSFLDQFNTTLDSVPLLQLAEQQPLQAVLQRTNEQSNFFHLLSEIHGNK